jgi:hypothetical protein
MAVFKGMTGSGVGVGVGGGVVGGLDVVVGGADGDGVATGAGLAADAQAPARKATASDIATGESEERIGCPPDSVAGETSRSVFVVRQQPVGMPTRRHPLIKATRPCR